jgi:predicted outer membrane protein
MRAAILASATVLLTTFAASAQSHPSPAQPQSSNQSVADSSTSDPNDPQKTWDKAFMKKTFESDHMVIELGEMAQQNSQSDSIKQFSQGMVEERKRFDAALDPVASKLGVDRPANFKDKKEVAKLKSLSGPAFDKEFLNLLTKQTQQDLKDSNSELTNTPNSGLKDIAAENAKSATKRLADLQTISK